MNISGLNSKIYGHKDLKEGQYVNFVMKSIEQQEIKNFNNNSINDKFNEINREIKF